MAADTSKTLTEAIAAVRLGDRRHARELLSRLLHADSQNAEYWVWMSAVVDSPRERVYCLESALKIDPTNRAAMRGLVLFGARSPSPSDLSHALKLPQREITPKEITPTAEEKQIVQSTQRKPAASPFKPKRRRSFIQLIGIVLFSGIAIAAVAGVASMLAPMFGPRFLGMASTLPPPSPTATDTPSSGTPTATPIPAATRIVRTPISTDFVATPLALLVSATSTPTPIAGFTPHPGNESYTFGVQAIKDGDYEHAIFLLDQALNIDPNFPEALYFKAEAQRLSGKIGEAIKSYDETLKLDWNYAAPYLGRGRALLERNDEIAEQDLNRAIEYDPLFVQAYEELGAFYERKTYWQRMETTMEQALSIGARSPQLLIYLSNAELILNQYQKALVYALEGSADDPTLLEGYLAVGRAYVAQGIHTLDNSYYPQAIWPLQTYVAYTSDDSLGWAALGRALLGAGQHEEALQALDIAIEINNRNGPAYLARGILYTERGEYETAIEDLNAARRFSPETFDLWIASGRALYLNGMYRDAQTENIDRAIEYARGIADNFLRERKLAEAYALRGLIYELNPENLNDAIRHWRYILEFEYALPETRALAEQHYNELTGVGPTRTPTVSPTPSPTATPEGAIETATPTTST
ncbi:MAG: tetratricopeptide repeat protein [Anaerolineales bacterium]|nr:tetratricopeptide repeat protein [Anaerolineales bacterium]